MNQPVAQLDVPKCSEEAVRALCYDGLRYRNPYYFDSLPVYLRMVNLAFHYGSANILELGAGLSTALWARYASRTGAKISTVDADLSSMRSYVESPNLNALIDKHVQLITGVTVSSAQLRDFYSTQHTTFGAPRASTIAEKIDAFYRPETEARVDATKAALDASTLKMRDIFIPDAKTLRFPPTLLDKLSPNGRFDKDVAFLDQHPRAAIDPSQTWDLIFFDSGEYSSCLEWLTLKDRIAVGGLAAFHDIFFPKSMKNFLPCAAILADPNWRVVWLDQSTIQGLLIAQRIN